MRFLLAALLAPALLALCSMWLGREYFATEAMRQSAHAAYVRRMQATMLIDRVIDAESSERGYVITGNPAFLERYTPVRASVLAIIDELGRAFGDEPDAQGRLTLLRSVALAKFAEMDRVIAERRDNGLGRAAALVEDRSGKILMDRMRTVSAELVEIALPTRDARAEAYNRRIHANLVGVWIGIGAIGMLLLVAALMAWRQRLAQFRVRIEAYSVAERNRAILQSTVDAIVIFNQSGMIETINPAAAELLGYEPEELVRHDVSAVIRLADQDVTFRDRMGRGHGHIASHHLPDRKAVHRDGHEIPVDIALGVMQLPDGDYVVASVHDISERKRAERMKDELISTVSHELRTPLTSIVGALGLLRSGAAGKIAAGPARLIEIAENNSRRLIRLINDMLDIDRIQSGQLALSRARIDLRDVASLACEGSQGAAEAAGVVILCDLPEEPVPVMGDADRLLQVISNLASNAIRVSDASGTVTIGVETMPDGKAMVTVDDEGPGVPVELRDRIFGRFERGRGAQGIGTGLGLAISREIVVRHDGRIWFEDRPTGGARFAFTLDLLREREEPILSSGPRILICEDDAETAEMLRSLVLTIGLDAQCVDTAAAARAALAQGDYVALLLDLNLPDANGLSVAHDLLTPDGALSLPIIIVSGLDRDGLNGSIPIDVVDWIEKPVDPSRLASAIRLAMGRSDTARPTILHLDDDEDVLHVTETALQFDARVFKATGLDSARALLETESFDLAILDMDLADGSGLELLPMLIDRDGVAIPTIIFSAHDVDAQAARKVDAVLVKSRGSMPDLKKTIRRVLGERASAA